LALPNISANLPKQLKKATKQLCYVLGIELIINLRSVIAGY